MDAYGHHFTRVVKKILHTVAVVRVEVDVGDAEAVAGDSLVDG